MTAIEAIDPVGRTATVQAGVTLLRLQEAAAAHGLAVPIDLGARGSCTIGGNVATNAGGINVIRHGMTRDNVSAWRSSSRTATGDHVPQPDGQEHAGYDTKQVFIGSEGTLGVVTRVVVRLVEAPVARHTAFAARRRSTRSPGFSSRSCNGPGRRLGAFEVMWGDYVRAVTGPASTAPRSAARTLRRARRGRGRRPGGRPGRVPGRDGAGG